jgi:hypothetical protein
MVGMFLFRKFYTSRSPEMAPVVLKDLLIRVMERMDPKVLANTMGVGTDGRPLERCWYVYVYRYMLILY